MITISLSKKVIATIWIVGFLIPFLLLIVMTNNNTLQDTKAAWGWFLPTMLPTVSLIVGVFVSDALTPDTKDKSVSRFFFLLACVFSVLYIVLVLLVAFNIPLTTSPTALDELLKNSNVYLGPVQGLVTLVLGVFFVNRSKEGERPGR
jgi:uncharacterized membrane protein (DUF485 family)